MIRHAFLFFLLSGVLLCRQIYAQEYIGLRTDNYAGSNGMLLNPASPMGGALPWDINILSAGFSANNNYIYAVDQSTISLLGSNGEEIPIGFFHPQKAYAYEQLFMQLPSGFIRLNNVAVGLFFTARNAGYLRTENYAPGIPTYDTISFNDPTDFPAFTAGMVNWSEIGVNGEFALLETSARSLYVGANIKYLIGYDAMTFDNQQLFTFTKGETTSSVTPVDMDFSYSSNLGTTDFNDNGKYRINGSGLGMDAGVVYLVRSNDIGDGTATDYNWKFGASVVDLGYIHFKRNAGDFHLSSDETVTISTTEIDSIGNLNEFNVTGSVNIYDNSEASQTSTEFNMVLPSAFTLSADKNLGGGFFINGLVVRRMPHLNSNLVARPNTIAVTPRFESRWFGFTMPLVLYEDQYFHLGTAARFGFLTIGSDNLLSWFIKDDTYTGTDIYAGIKINPVWLSGNDAGGVRNSKARQLKCPKM